MLAPCGPARPRRRAGRAGTSVVLRAVAGQELDVLHRQEQLVAAGILHLQAVVRRAGRLDGLRPTKRPMPWSTWTTRSPGVSAATSAGQSCGRLRLALLAHQPVAQDVLLGDDREVARRRSRLRGPRPRPRRRCRLRQGVDVREPRRSAPASSGRGRRARRRAGRGSRRTRLPRITRWPRALQRRAHAPRWRRRRWRFSSARSAAKLRPWRPSQSITARSALSGSAKGVSRATLRRRDAVLPLVRA